MSDRVCFFELISMSQLQHSTTTNSVLEAQSSLAARPRFWTTDAGVYADMLGIELSRNTSVFAVLPRRRFQGLVGSIPISVPNLGGETGRPLDGPACASLALRSNG
jgi:hypothetical protein